MSDPYERAIGGRLVYKGGALATLNKTIDKKKKHKKKNKNHQNPNPSEHESDDQILNDEELQRLQESGEVSAQSDADRAAAGGGEEVYTIDAAKKMKYDELFPVEAKKFGYDPKTKARSVEEALDDRVKKKADRYCK
ncbi:hypothetical protein Sjap_014642 [Stephania japonica]|uniref:Uncharacterized protein n=1 Tax=Stephania japonica TaxID=461633 RepID=A0AAP0IIE7_9MAGN